MSSRNGIRVNQGLSKELSISFLPVRLIAPATIIICGGFFLKVVIPGLGWIWVLIGSAGLIVFWFLLTWQGNYHYLSQFARYRLPNWKAKSGKQHTAPAKSPLNSGPLPDPHHSATKLSKAPFEHFNLVSILDFQYEGQNVGAYLLKRTSVLSRILGNSATDWQVVFCWQSEGYHAHQTEEAFAALHQRVDMALRELPADEQLTFVQRLRAEDSASLDALAQQRAATDNPALKVLATWEMARQQELVAEGQRQQIDLLIFATYSQTQGLMRGDDWVAVVLNSLQLGPKLFWLPIKQMLPRALKFISGELEQHDSELLRRFLRKAYIQGYFHWNAYVTQKLRLNDAQSLNPEDCWQEIWQQLNGAEPAPALPSVIEVSTTRIAQRQAIDIDPRRLLLRHLPQGHADHVQVAGTYQMLARCIAKPGGAANGTDVMRQLWERAYQSRDVELITQVSRADIQTTRALLGFQSRRATHVAKRAETMDMPDVGANLTRQSSLDAEVALLSGVGVIHIAFLVKVTAPNRATAEARLRELCRRFPVPMVVEIDRYNAWNTWMQTLLGVTWKHIGRYGSFDQRLLMLSSEVPLLLPLAMPRGGER